MRISEDRSKLNAALIETAARVRVLETESRASEGRITALDSNARTIRSSLDERRGVIAEILAALQRIGRRPPPALMVRPEDALQAVRTAMLLGAVLPEMRVEAEALVADLTELARVRKEIAAEIETRLARPRCAVAGSPADDAAGRGTSEETGGHRAGAAERSANAPPSLARTADSLKDLIAKLEQDVGARAEARPQRRARGARRKGRRTDASLAALKDPGRLAPAIAFVAAKGVLPLPVNGVRIREFGAADRLGSTEKGLSIATRAGAQVTAPCDGWVVYAGPFRSYGQLLILNAGGGYHVLLAGMERISVDLGQFVLTGEPVAIMGTGSQRDLGAAGSSQPVLYVEFRKDGTPVDPGPWWATQARRFADDAQDFPGSPRRLGGRGVDAGPQPAARGLRRCRREGGRLRYLPPAQPVRRRVRTGAFRLCGEARRRQADRLRHQRHADRARSAFELHGSQELQGHADPDARRVRRPGNRSHHGGRPGEGGRADRRDACRTRPACSPATSSPISTTSRCRGSRSTRRSRRCAGRSTPRSASRSCARASTSRPR